MSYFCCGQSSEKCNIKLENRKIRLDIGARLKITGSDFILHCSMNFVLLVLLNIYVLLLSLAKFIFVFKSS